MITGREVRRQKRRQIANADPTWGKVLMGALEVDDGWPRQMVEA